MRKAGFRTQNQPVNGGLRMEDEKRRFTRFPLNMNTILDANNKSYDVDGILNLSIGGGE